MENYPNYPHVYNRQQQQNQQQQHQHNLHQNYGPFGSNNRLHSPYSTSSNYGGTGEVDEDEWNFGNSTIAATAKNNYYQTHDTSSRCSSAYSNPAVDLLLSNSNTNYPNSRPQPPQYNNVMPNYTSPSPVTVVSNNKLINNEQILNNQNRQQQHLQNAAVLRQLQAKFSLSENNKEPVQNYSQLQVQTRQHNNHSTITTTTTTTSATNNASSLGNVSAAALAGSRANPTIANGNGSSNGNNNNVRPRSADDDEDVVSSSSYWLMHGRIPLLILLVLLLFIVFLSFSAALVYFKYVPYSTNSAGNVVNSYSNSNNNHNNLVQFGGTSSILKDEPCEQTFCAFGAVCIVENGHASCKCPESCSAGYSPVCGTDQVTYSNECLLRKFACKQQKSVRVLRTGECDMVDPCADKACLFGSRCVPSADGHYAACECPKECPNYGDTDESQNVCGSDGKLYRNKCEMNRHACHLGRTISVKYMGKCDPCEDINCMAPAVCQLDEDRRPVCKCNEICSTTELNPICASDGRTYTNECVMRQEGCKGRITDLRVIYRGKCSQGVNPCLSLSCGGFESCVINRFGIAQCTCSMVCDEIIQPVCGSDGKTYDNYCKLTQNACNQQKEIQIGYKGICESSSLCARQICPIGATCIERHGVAVCECPSCPSDYDPVCGSDGISYQNPCRLKQEACNTNTTISVLYQGLCNGCETKRCEYYSTCESDISGTRCICPQNCTSLSVVAAADRVCGSDGQTYQNECELQKASCLQRRFIATSGKGHCDLCSNVHCKYGARCEAGVCECPTVCPTNKVEPVCGSNFETFVNECELQKAACARRERGGGTAAGHPLSLLFYGNCSEGRPLGGSIFQTSGFGLPAPTVPVSYNNNYEVSFSSSSAGSSSSSGTGGGINNNANTKLISSSPGKLCDSIRCDFDAVCEIGDDGFPRCTCQFNCSKSSAKVCASDLKLYESECEMKREACHRQTELRPRPMELCEEIEVRPCNGEEPVKYPGTEIEINCGGPTRCPAGTFCHRSPSFAKCCRKSEGKDRLHGIGIGTTTSKIGIELSICVDSLFGCCPDEITAASGQNYAGCPSFCQCNKVGSVHDTCDPVTGTCKCKPGVGGDKCDRCLPGFWGLSRIVSDAQNGCLNCGCSKFGSVREDCEQMTGRCVCKPNVLGHKCDSCTEGEFLGPYGCTSDPINLGQTCEQVSCSYGAECEQDGGRRAGCVCNLQCDDKNIDEVCASDGFTYESECLVRLQSCRSQKAIWVVHKGPCTDSSEFDGTESPTRRRWTGDVAFFTEPGDVDEDDQDEDGEDESGDVFWKSGNKWGDQGSRSISSGYSGMKSTRHLPPQSNYHDNFHNTRNFYNQHRSPTQATTVEIKSYLGDSCQSSSECVTTFSVCLDGFCICKEGFYEDGERIQCKPIHSHVTNLDICLSSDECHPSSTCFDNLNGSHSCLCPLGTADIVDSTPSGDGNENGCAKQEFPYPFFTGNSTIVLGKLAGYHKLSIEIEITPHLDFEHGILVFSSQHANGSGDFLSLALIDGYVEFRYGLGDGPAKLRSVNRLAAGRSYHVIAKRYNRDGLLRVNDEEDVKGTSPGSMKSLDLDHGRGYLGFIPLNSTKVWETVGASHGFIGCVHRLRVGRRPIDFGGTRDPLINSVQNVYQCLDVRLSSYHQHKHSLHYTTPFHGLSEAGGEDAGPIEQESLTLSLPNNSSLSDARRLNPCAKNPCRNHGLCWTDFAQNSVSYKCVCHPEFSGRHCESRTANVQENGAMLDFRGFTFLELPKIENGGRQVSIELWVMIRAMNGLVLYNGQFSGKGDYVAIHVLNGHIQFLFDLGSGMANITWTKPVTFGKWHWIQASREERNGKLQVDGEPPQFGVSPPSLWELNLELPLYLGGIRDTMLLHRELGLLAPFDGVFQYMKVNGQTYHREISAAIRERQVHKYEGPPCGSSLSAPCENGGTCFPRLSSFSCVCPSAYTGKICEHRKEIPGPIRFDGQNFLRFPRKVVKSESFNFTSEYDDDFYNENFDSALDELFGGESNLANEGSGVNVVGESDEGADFDEASVGIGAEDAEEFNPLEEHEQVQNDRMKIQKRNRIEIIFRTLSSSSGVLVWTGSQLHPSEPSKRGYLGLFIVDGFPELRVDLGSSSARSQDSSKKKVAVIIRSKVSVSDGRWHQVLIARRRRFIVFQVDDSAPQRATAPPGSNILHSDGRFWIGGVAASVLPAEIPARYHQGFVGCVDLVRIEKRRLPLTKAAYSAGIPFCEDDD